MNSYNVLIVDDSVAIRKILLRVVTEADQRIRQIYEAGDGVEALQVLKDNSIGLILSDINMPTMDGLQLLTAVKANPTFQAIPVLMITTEGAQNKVLEAVRLGAAGYVRKPFTAEQIKERLTTLR